MLWSSDSFFLLHLYKYVGWVMWLHIIDFHPFVAFDLAPTALPRPPLTPLLLPSGERKHRDKWTTSHGEEDRKLQRWVFSPGSAATAPFGSLRGHFTWFSREVLVRLPRGFSLLFFGMLLLPLNFTSCVRLRAGRRLVWVSAAEAVGAAAALGTARLG